MRLTISLEFYHNGRIERCGSMGSGRAIVQRGRTLAARQKSRQLDAVPEARHLVQEDAPKAIVAAVLRPFTGPDR